MERADIEDALLTLGELLARMERPIEILVVGGGNLLLTGWIDRPTQDVDVVAFAGPDGYSRAETMPAFLSEAVSQVGRALGIGERWLNTGPAGLLELGLPEGFDARVEVRTFDALTVHLAGRSDLVAFKLFAAADLYPRNEKHVADLWALRATTDELRAGAEWASSHDDSAGFTELLELTLAQVEGGGRRGDR